jgi:hypothetical protein
MTDEERPSAESRRRKHKRHLLVGVLLGTVAGLLLIGGSIALWVTLKDNSEIQAAATAFHADALAGRFDDAYSRTTETFKLAYGPAAFQELLADCPAFKKQFLC